METITVEQATIRTDNRGFSVRRGLAESGSISIPLKQGIGVSVSTLEENKIVVFSEDPYLEILRFVGSAPSAKAIGIWQERRPSIYEIIPVGKGEKLKIDKKSDAARYDLYSGSVVLVNKTLMDNAEAQRIAGREIPSLVVQRRTN